MNFISPLGAGFLLFLKRFERENAKEESIDFDLNIKTVTSNNLSVNKIQSHNLSISVVNES